MKLRWAFFVLIILEIAASTAVIMAIGWIPSAALWLFLGACGLYLLGHRNSQVDLISGFLLLAPGFLSSVAGLVIRLSRARSFLMTALGLKGIKRSNGTVDLDPKEWRKD